MNARYYYLSADGRTVHGPFGMQDMWALRDRGIITMATQLCREGMENWLPLGSYPELAAKPTVERVTTYPVSSIPPVLPRVARTTKPPGAFAVGCSVVFLLLCFCVMLSKCQTAAVAPAAVATPATVSPPPTPLPTPPGDARNGGAIARRLVAKYPRLNVYVLSGETFQKSDGVSMSGASGGRATLEFLLPEYEWDALSTSERDDLGAFMESKIPYVRAHWEDFIMLSKGTELYYKAGIGTRHMNSGSWYIAAAKTYPDDPQNFYMGRRLTSGPSAWQ